MTPEKIRLIQESFARLAPHAEMLGSLFYSRLFVTHPELRSLFANDMRVQERKLMQTIAVVVESLENATAVLPTLKELGMQHVGYKVQPADYTPVGEALIWTFQQSLGEDFTPALQEAWLEAYTLITTVMLDFPTPPAS